LVIHWPGIGEAVPSLEGVGGIDHQLLCSNDPGTAGDYWTDSRRAVDVHFLIDAAMELGVQERCAHKPVADFHLSFRMENSHARGAASTARRTINLAGPDRDGVLAVQNTVLRDHGICHLAEGNVSPVVRRMFESQLFIGSIRDLHAGGGSLEESLRKSAAAIPVRRIGTPQEFGALCAFLCSQHAGYITGQTIGIDGGALVGVH